MTYQVIIEREADRALREKYRWIAVNRSPAKAESWFRSIAQAILTLRTRPTRHPVADENDRFVEEIRELLHGRGPQKYRVLFTIRGEFVHVLYVRHCAQDAVEP